MNKNMKLIIEEYLPFINKLEKWINNRILINLNINVEISYENTTCLAGNLFNKIIVYINNYTLNDENMAKNMLLYSVIHEAIHQNQLYDIYRYHKDTSYAMFVENNVNYTTINYIIDNYKELTDVFKINIFPYDIANFIKRTNQEYYIKINKESKDIKTFIKLISLYDKTVYNNLYNLYINYDTIDVNYIIDGIVIKYNIKSKELNYKVIEEISNRYTDNYFLDTVFKIIINNSDSSKLNINIYSNKNENKVMRRLK